MSTANLCADLQAQVWPKAKNGLQKCPIVPDKYSFKKYKFRRQRANVVAPTVYLELQYSTLATIEGQTEEIGMDSCLCQLESQLMSAGAATLCK